jgi:SAM-dependent methyltransferase
MLHKVPVALEEKAGGAVRLLGSLRCVSCHADGSIVAERDGLRCSRCSRSYGSPDGILDLRAEDSHTHLDELDYDSVYNTDLEQSFAYFEGMKQRVAPVLDGAHELAVEIGSGTGYLSTPLAGALRFEQLALTDVSLKMLRVCKRKVSARYAHQPELLRKVSYVAMDGNEFSFSPETIGLAFGHGVLHHILEYQKFLGVLHQSLRPDGVAVFLEPNYKFHMGLLLLLSGMMEKVVGSLEDPKDVEALIRFYQHLSMSWRFRGDARFSARIEDKHLFSRKETLALLKELGFAHAEVLPAYGKQFFSAKMAGYLDELKVSPKTRSRVMEYVLAQQVLLAEIMDPEGLSSADIYLFEKQKGPTARVRDVHPTHHRTAWELLAEQLPAEARGVSVHIDTVRKSADGTQLRVSGWASSSVPLKRVLVKGTESECFVVEARPDVLRAHRDELGPAPDALLFSGFELPWLPQQTSLELVFEFLDGCTSRPHLVSLPAASGHEGQPASLRVAVKKAVHSLQEHGALPTARRVVRYLKARARRL